MKRAQPWLQSITGRAPLRSCEGCYDSFEAATAPVDGCTRACLASGGRELGTHKKKFIIGPILAVIIASSVSSFWWGNYSQSSPIARVSVVDDIGKTVVLEGPQKRIVSMAPGVTEMLFALGLGDRVVGDTYGCDYPPEAMNIEKISARRNATMGSGPGPAPSDQPFGPFYIDKIVQLRPDLVIMDRSYDTWQLDWYSKVKNGGLNVLVLWPKNLEDVLRDITLVGEVTSSQENATRLVSSLRQRVNVVEEKVGNLSDTDRPRVFATVYYDGKSFWTFGPGYHKPEEFVDEIIKMAGGINIVGNQEGLFEVDVNTVIRDDPQIILVLDDPRYSVPAYETIMNDKKLSVTEALQNNAVHYLDERPWVRAGPRLVDSIELVARLFYPELFN